MAVFCLCLGFACMFVKEKCRKDLELGEQRGEDDLGGWGSGKCNNIMFEKHFLIIIKKEKQNSSNSSCTVFCCCFRALGVVPMGAESHALSGAHFGCCAVRCLTATI